MKASRLPIVWKALVPLLLLGAGFAVAIGTLGSGGRDDRAAPATRLAPGKAFADHDDVDTAQYAEIVDSLSELLNLEVMERRRLEAQLDDLAARFDELSDQVGVPGEDRRLRVGAEPIAAETPDPDEARLARFREAGFEPERAAYLKRRQDEISMQRLYLRDRARREGWMGTTRYAKAMRELSNDQTQLRQELGDTDYDRYLYAIGRPNRVMVRSVLEGSPAEQAGLNTGDAILSYDAARVFSVREIVGATAVGSAGTSTPIEIDREGQHMVLYVPRGPLGVNLGPAVVKPGG